ncbi:MAG TPA: hypothetical protein VLX85_09015 [Stellaceae bacterium]|nr:hypothetical protein [Stellaceae bacterium]
MALDRTHAAQQLRTLVWSGFYEADEIFEIVTEYEDELGAEDAAWAESAIARAVEERRAAEKTWPAVTDCDRLDQAFAALESAGIIALHNAGYTLSDGTSDVSEAYHERGGKSSGISGYCFYHGQDVERAVAGQGLDLAFGDIEGDAAKGVAIGRRIVAELTRQGLAVEWSGAVEKRLFIPLFDWRRRGP